MKTPRIVVISAPSGGGKTTLIRALLKLNPKLQSVITHTTRTMRPGEIEDVHYHFVDSTVFEEMITQDAFIEWAKVYDQYYGASKMAVQKVLDQNKIPIINLDWQGAQNVRRIYGIDALTIFILPPNLEALEQRLQSRGDSPANIQKRLGLAEEEIAHAKEYDYIVMNDDFNKALDHLQEILQAALNKA